MLPPPSSTTNPPLSPSLHKVEALYGGWDGVVGLWGGDPLMKTAAQEEEGGEEGGAMVGAMVSREWFGGGSMKRKDVCESYGPIDGMMWWETLVDLFQVIE